MIIFFISIIEDEIAEREVKDAWQKSFSYYKNVLDDTRKARIIDIKRQSTKLMIEDIVKFLRKKELSSDLVLFAVPWYYNINSFVSEDQQLSQTWHKQTAIENEKRLNELESRIEA